MCKFNSLARRGFRVAVLAMAATSVTLGPVGCGVMTVDVDVYKGPLANHQDVFITQLADMAMAVKPLLVAVRNQLELASLASEGRGDISEALVGEEKELANPFHAMLAYEFVDTKNAAVAAATRPRLQMRELRQVLAYMLTDGYFLEGDPPRLLTTPDVADADNAAGEPSSATKETNDTKSTLAKRKAEFTTLPDSVRAPRPSYSFRSREARLVNELLLFFQSSPESWLEAEVRTKILDGAASATNSAAPNAATPGESVAATKPPVSETSSKASAALKRRQAMALLQPRQLNTYQKRIDYALTAEPRVLAEQFYRDHESELAGAGAEASDDPTSTTTPASPDAAAEAKALYDARLKRVTDRARTISRRRAATFPNLTASAEPSATGLLGLDALYVDYLNKANERSGGDDLQTRRLLDAMLVLANRLSLIANHEAFATRGRGFFPNLAEGLRVRSIGETMTEAASRQYVLVLQSIGNGITAQVDALKQERSFDARLATSQGREAIAATDVNGVSLEGFLRQIRAMASAATRDAAGVALARRSARDTAKAAVKAAQAAINERLAIAALRLMPAIVASALPLPAFLGDPIAEASEAWARVVEARNRHAAAQATAAAAIAAAAEGDRAHEQAIRVEAAIADVATEKTLRESAASELATARPPTRETWLWLLLAGLEQSRTATPPPDPKRARELGEAVAFLKVLPRLTTSDNPFRPEDRERQHPGDPPARTPDTARDVLDGVIAQLRYQYLVAVRDSGPKDPLTLRIAEALEQAYNQRSDMIFIRPASSYLRTSFAASNLQRDASLKSRNMLGEQASKAIPFYDRFQDTADYAILRQIDKQFWQNINTVRLSGYGRTNYVVAKDDVGNWYVKNYSSDPEPIIKSAKNLALFSMGAKLGAPDAFRLVRDQDAAAAAAAAKESGQPVPKNGGGTVAGNSVFGRQFTSIVASYDSTSRTQLAELKTKVDGLEATLTKAWTADATLKDDAATLGKLEDAKKAQTEMLASLKTTAEETKQAEAVKQAADRIAQARTDGKEPAAADLKTVAGPVLPASVADYSVGNQIIDGLAKLRAYRNALVVSLRSALLLDPTKKLETKKSELAKAKQDLAALAATAPADEKTKAETAVANAQKAVTEAQETLDVAIKQAAAAAQAVMAQVDGIVTPTLGTHRESVQTLDIGIGVIGSSISK